MSQQKEDIRSILVEGCEGLNIALSDAASSALQIYYTELRRWSRKVNLIAKKATVIQIVENHFLDSLILAAYVSKPGSSLVDVGTGAGFPGLVCKSVLPDLSLTLVEPRLKRVSFLRHIIRTLELDGVEVLASRIEDVDDGKFSSCTCITSRAVAEIEPFLQMVEALANTETDIICMKGPRWKSELEQASMYLQQTGLALYRVEEFELPFSAAKRALLIFRKAGSNSAG